MINVVHDNRVCPEWEPQKGSWCELPKDKILRNLGRTEEQIAAIKESDAENALEDRLFVELERA